MVFDFLLQGFALVFIVVVAIILVLAFSFAFCMALALFCETIDLFCRCHRTWLESKREVEAQFAEKMTV